MTGKSTQRVITAAKAAGLEIEILTMPESTRTAQEAAIACGCDVQQIVKSLIFERADSKELVLLLIPGDQQADLIAVAKALKGSLERADAKRVRTETGFAIGGVAPLGHLVSVPVYMHPALLEHDTVWAAAGSPNAVFSVNPERLRKATNATLLD